MKLIQKNFIYNNVLGLTNIIVPLIVFPYLTRTLGPSGIGIVQFAVSLASIFVLIGSLGLPIYGIREIAKCNHNKEKLKKTYSELLIIQLFSTVFSLFFFYLFIQATGILLNETAIKYLSYFYIIASLGLLHWFYQGIENFRFITIVNFTSKILSLAAIFFLVKRQEDYWVYFLILTVVLVICSLINIFYSLYFSGFTLKNLNFRKHLNSIIILFGTQLAVGIYLNLDVVFLKYFSSDYEVGLYTPASKIVKLFIFIITSLGAVLIPKLTIHLKNNQHKESGNIITKSIQFVILISLPIIVLLSVISNDLIELFAGMEFLKSGLLLIFLCPIILIIGLSNIFGLQILVPINQEKKLLLSIVIGALFSVFLNFLLIPIYKSFGVVFSLLITEVIITALTFYFSRKFLFFKIPFISGLKYLFFSLLILPFCLFFKIYFDGLIFLVIASLTTIIIYLLCLIVSKDKFFRENIVSPILIYLK